MPAKSQAMSPTPHKPQVSTLGDFLKKIRQARDWSQTELANLCRVDQSYISMIESGRFKKPPLDFIKDLYRNVLTVEEKAELMLVLYACLDDYVES